MTWQAIYVRQYLRGVDVLPDLRELHDDLLVLLSPQARGVNQPASGLLVSETDG
jgi:hypothetical protein